MTQEYPQFYVSESPDGEDVAPVYYKVTGPDPDGHVFWRRESMGRPKEQSFYGLFLEEKNGDGLEVVEREQTPWGK